MKLINLVLGIIFIVNIRVVLAQSEYLSCNYTLSNYQYICYLTIYNSNGLNNFQNINGTHLTGKSESDVMNVYRVFGSNTTNVPSIICNTFKNSESLFLQSSGIKKIDEDAFKSCIKMKTLSLSSNDIFEIPENTFSENVELENLILMYNQIQKWPESIFTNLHKLRNLDLDNNGIASLPNYIFKPLKLLSTLQLQNNRLSSIKVEWFESLEHLNYLYLHANKIEQLPKNVFSPLIKLIGIWLHGNKLKVIDSNSFSRHPKFTTIYAHLNEINAIDERIIENTNLTFLDLRINLCANESIFDNSTSRSIMRTKLSLCFDNFQNLAHETTTAFSTTSLPSATTTYSETSTTFGKTLPPGCIGGNLDERICRIEDKNEEFYENIQELRDENQRLREESVNLNSTVLKMQEEIIRLGDEVRNFNTEGIPDLVNTLNDENKRLNAAIDELQDNIKELNEMFENAFDDLQNQILESSANPYVNRFQGFRTFGPRIPIFGSYRQVLPLFGRSLSAFPDYKNRKTDKNQREPAKSEKIA